MKNSPTLEVIASPVAIFILLRKRKHFKRCAAQTVYQQLAKPKKRSNLTFQAWVAIFTLRRMNTLSAAGKEPKTRTGHVRLRKRHFGDSCGSGRSLIKFVPFV